MPKDHNEPEQKLVTKKHIARMEKEQKQRKWLLTGIISLLAVIVILVTYGVLDNTVLQPGKPVAKVNDDKISVEQFQKRVKYERLSLTQSFLNYALSSYAMFFQSQLLQVQNQMDDYIQFGSDTLDDMIQEKLVAQEAEKLGITVSEEEIDKEIQENFGYYANGTPTPAPTIEYKPTSTLSAAQLKMITLTPTPTESPTATVEAVTPTVETTVSATTEGTEEVVNTPTATALPPTSTPTVAPTATEILPTPTEYTYEGFQGLYATMVAGVNEETGFGDPDFREYVRSIIYNRKLYEYLTKDVAQEQEMVWARHILVKTEPEAQMMLTKLKEGDDWTTLAANYSQDTSNSASGGDLGWFTKGQMVTEFETAAWNLEIGEISEPVKTEFGYHIIQVIGHEVRQLSEEELRTAKSTVYQTFIDNAKTAASIKKFDVWASVVPSEPSIPTEYRIADTATGQ